jgi:hypothetical protein
MSHFYQVYTVVLVDFRVIVRRRLGGCAVSRHYLLVDQVIVFFSLSIFVPFFYVLARRIAVADIPVISVIILVGAFMSICDSLISSLPRMKANRVQLPSSEAMTLC